MLAAAVACLPCCGRKNPLGSDGVLFFSLSGRALDADLEGVNNVSVRVRGNGNEWSILTSPDGEFSVPELPEGEYTVTASKSGYVLKPDSITVSSLKKGEKTASFYGMGEEEYRTLNAEGAFVVFGRIATTEDMPVRHAVIADGVSTDEHGCYRRYGTRGKAVSCAPQKSGYIFSPANITLNGDEPIVICDFSAVYSGPRVYSISGRVYVEELPANGALVSLTQMGKCIAKCVTGRDGGYVFSDVQNGIYTLAFAGNGCCFDTESRAAEVKGANVVIPDVQGTYHVPTWYGVKGRVVGRTCNKGMPGVKVAVQAEHATWGAETMITDSEGFFEANDMFWVEGQTSVTFVPEKENCTFSPEKVTISLVQRDRTVNGGIVVLPADFIATDCAEYRAADYFPCHYGAVWMYERTVNENPPSQYRVTVSGGCMNNGLAFRQFSPCGCAGLSLFRVEGNSVYALRDNSRVELLRFGELPGATWKAGIVWDYKTIWGTFVGLETVTVPAGTFIDCMKFQITCGGLSYECCTVWLAKSTGIVRSEKVIVNFGELNERIVDVLAVR